MSSIKAIIFDCDGVMFDSRQANVNFYNHLLAHFDLPPMEESDVAFVHMQTADESIRQIFRNTPYAEEALRHKMGMDYAPFIKDMIIELDLKALLRLLKPRFGLAIATNRSHTIGDVLESQGLKEFFDIVISSLDVQRPKPHPESLFRILGFFQLSSTQALYVGDSPVDYDTAKAAKVPFISYKNRALKADFHVDCHLDIYELVK